MSLLAVVRHGQASFLAQNYDKLSTTGEHQSALLGQYWAEAGVQFTHVFHGPAQRQIRTGEIVAEQFRAAGIPWPEPVVDPDFDEFPAEDIFRKLLPVLLSRHPHLAEQMALFEKGTDMLVRQRVFDSVLREVTQRWLAGEVSDESIISWPAFCDRIAAAVKRITQMAGRGSRVALFTSGGPTAATVRVALGLTPAATLELTWSPRNASVSEFLFSGERFSLSTFNTTPHLKSADLLTYR